MRPREWHVLTGEYPPHVGGVSDFTEQVATALAERVPVHVWSPTVARPGPQGRVHVHALAGWSARDLATVGRALGRGGRATLLVQWVPNSFGGRGANVAFAAWLLLRRLRGDDVRVFFHEPYMYFARAQPFRWNVLALLHRVMAFLALTAASVAYLSVPAWVRYLRPCALLRTPRFEWVPIPSSIPVVDDPAAVAALRARWGPGRLVVGHFGTYGANLRGTLARTIETVLARSPRALFLLLGRGGAAFREELLARNPPLADRLVAPGTLDRRAVSVHLQACDVLALPYPDGVSSRRTTVMAGLSHGIAVATTRGFLSEAVWAREELVATAPAEDADAFAALVEELLRDEEARLRVATRGRAGYARHFGPERLAALAEVNP